MYVLVKVEEFNGDDSYIDVRHLLRKRGDIMSAPRRPVWCVGKMGPDYSVVLIDFGYLSEADARTYWGDKLGKE
jgi:hypothetical protein